MVALYSFTRKAWAVPMKKELPKAFMNAYPAIEKQLGGEPDLLFVSNEGASQGQSSKFQLHLEKQKTILKRKQGRNDLAVIDAYMASLGRTVRKMTIEGDLTEKVWKTLAMEAIPIVNNRSRKRFDGSTWKMYSPVSRVRTLMTKYWN